MNGMLKNRAMTFIEKHEFSILAVFIFIFIVANLTLLSVLDEQNIYNERLDRVDKYLVKLENNIAALQNSLPSETPGNKEDPAYIKEVTLLKHDVTEIKIILSFMSEKLSENAMSSNTSDIQDKLDSLRKHAHPPEEHEKEIEKLEQKMKSLETSAKMFDQHITSSEKKMNDITNKIDYVENKMENTMDQCNAYTNKKFEAIESRYIIQYEIWIFIVIFVILVCSVCACVISNCDK